MLGHPWQSWVAGSDKNVTLISPERLSQWELSESTEEDIAAAAAVLQTEQQLWGQHWAEPQPLYILAT